MDGTVIEEALSALGATLAERNEQASLLVIGGASLILLGLVDRATADVDVVAATGRDGYVAIDALPPAIATAAAQVGRALGLGDGWLNAGPAGMTALGLPPGIEERVAIRRFHSLEVHLAGRRDLVCFKLYAAVDLAPGSRHLDDIRALDPTPDELIAAARWTRTHDDSVGFLHNLRLTLGELGVEVDDVDL